MNFYCSVLWESTILSDITESDISEFYCTFFLVPFLNMIVLLVTMFLPSRFVLKHIGISRKLQIFAFLSKEWCRCTKALPRSHAMYGYVQSFCSMLSLFQHIDVREFVSALSLHDREKILAMKADLDTFGKQIPKQLVCAGIKVNKKENLEAHIMKHLAAGAHLPTPRFFDPVEHQNYRADYSLVNKALKICS